MTTRLTRGDVDLGLARDAGELAAVILDLPGSDDRERLLVAAITVVNLAGGAYDADEIRLAQTMATHIAFAFVSGEDAVD